jgi:hypothetical protein
MPQQRLSVRGKRSVLVFIFNYFNVLDSDILVIEARGLKAADFGGTSDPYVEGIFAISAFDFNRISQLD